MNSKDYQNHQYSLLKKLTNAVEAPLLNTSLTKDTETHIRLLPDSNLTPGLFYPSSLQGIFKAHPQTIQALRKDLWFIEESFLDLNDPAFCSSCSREWDFQFWRLCPFCLKNLEKK